MVEDAHAFPCISIGFCSVPTKNIARIITGVGMGGEYPLASSHSAESSEDAGDGARNVALLYLFGSGGGQALCPLVTYLMDVSGVPEHLLWRWIFAVGSILPVGQHIAALWFTFATFVVGKCRKLWTVDVVWLDGGCYIYIYAHMPAPLGFCLSSILLKRYFSILITFNVYERVFTFLWTDIYGHARLFMSMPLTPKLPSTKTYSMFLRAY